MSAVRALRSGITGSGGKPIAVQLGAAFVNEILAQAAFAGAFYPHARTIIEMGGEDAKLISLGRGRDGRIRIEDFSMNTAIWSRVTGLLGQYFPPPQPEVIPSRPNCSIQGSNPVVQVMSENGTPGTHVGGV